MKMNLLNGVNRFLVEKARKNDRDFSHFHPSSWDDCRRKTAYQYYEAKGFIVIEDEALKIDAQLERIFDNGHYVHSRWGYYLENAVPGALYGRWKCKNWMAHEEPIIFGEDLKFGCPKPSRCECGSSEFDYIEVGFMDKETMWGGHVDAIVDAEIWNAAMLNRSVSQNKLGENLIAVEVSDFPPPKDENLAVFDYKSMNPYQFKTLDQPLPKHKTQMQIYLYLSGLKTGKFLYENKANQAVKEFLVERDDHLIEVKKMETDELKTQLTTLNSAGKHVLPDRPIDATGVELYSKGHKTCLQCKYRGHCWRGIEDG